jgi:hypothetical protein
VICYFLADDSIEVREVAIPAAAQQGRRGGGGLGGAGGKGGHLTQPFNPLLFIRGLSCPSSIQASLSLNCLKLTIPGFPHTCLPVSCGDIGFLKKILGLVFPWKSGLKVPFPPLGRSS